VKKWVLRQECRDYKCVWEFVTSAAEKKSGCWKCGVTEEGDVLCGKAVVAMRVFPQENCIFQCEIYLYPTKICNRNCAKYLHVSYHGWRRFRLILLSSSVRTLQTHNQTKQKRKKLCPIQMLHHSELSVLLMKQTCAHTDDYVPTQHSFSKKIYW